MSLCLSVPLSLCPSVSLSLCFFVPLSLCSSVSLSLCFFVSLSLCPSVSLSSLSLSFLSPCLSVYPAPSVCLSLFLPFFLINYLPCLFWPLFALYDSIMFGPHPVYCIYLCQFPVLFARQISSWLHQLHSGGGGGKKYRGPTLEITGIKHNIDNIFSRGTKGVSLTVKGKLIKSPCNVQIKACL